ncbi:hypothetical protein [Komagataeibacter saccharivorans]|uniref:hypothetical protein n=1 Tax=Komagataeibacter saccharivorans TaxID=265959 RepID=UPI000C81B0EC|nr:hypothetical protein [Komagataeibacter saccharivorans]
MGGSVRNARLRAPTVDVLESGIVSGELTADEIIIRGRVEDAVIHAKRFYASATAKVANCTIILEGHTGCGIHKDADLTGEIKLVTAGVAPARPAGSERKVQAEAAPAARPAVSGASVVGPADKAADNTEEAPASPVDTGTASSSSLPDWDNVDEALRSAATADGHVVLVDPVKDAE